MHRYADARAAVALGLMMVIGTLWKVVVYPGELTLRRGLLPKDDRTLKGEIARAGTEDRVAENGSRELLRLELSLISVGVDSGHRQISRFPFQIDWTLVIITGVFAAQASWFVVAVMIL